MDAAAWSLFVNAVGIYLLLGVLFALVFVIKGVGRVDPVARAGTWGFRLLILPGATALWPLLAWRWLKGQPPRVEANAHRRAALKGRGRP